MTGWRFGLMVGLALHPMACLAVEWLHVLLDGEVRDA
jgi:hypothetical protein